MKKTLSLSLLAALIFSFTSCVKTVDTTPPPPASHPLTGSWYISSSDVSNDGYNWYTFDANMPGVFTFYNNGIADYDDNVGTMSGTWTMDVVDGDYYDEDGNYLSGEHNNLVIYVEDRNTYLNLALDYVDLYNRNSFTGTYYNGKSIERYTFSRY